MSLPVRLETKCPGQDVPSQTSCSGPGHLGQDVLPRTSVSGHNVLARTSCPGRLRWAILELELCLQDSYFYCCCLFPLSFIQPKNFSWTMDSIKQKPSTTRMHHTRRTKRRDFSIKWMNCKQNINSAIISPWKEQLLWRSARMRQK